MSWKRLPTFLANLPLRLMPFTEQQQKAFEATGHVSNVAFKTSPRVGKLEIKQFLERVYGLRVAAIQTVNYEGKKKRRKTGYFLRPGYKKREVRKNAGKGTSKKSMYFLEFYLVDNHGYETLAATGEDQGDAHYTYRNVPSFTKHGEMSVHNRKELLAWLDKIIEDTQRAHNFHLVSDDEDVLSGGLVAPGSPVQLPTFITFRQQKVQDEHGCRHQKWWLVDDNGHEHLAVVGDEREPRDGHYTYVAEKPFALIRPLNCQNQAKVTSYLEDWITHPQQNVQDLGPVASPSRSQPRTYITTVAADGDTTSQPTVGRATPAVTSTPAPSQPGSANDAGTSAPGKKTGWGSQSKAMRSSLRGKTSKGKKGSKSGKGGIKRNASFAFQPGDGGFDGISGRRRSLNEEEAVEAAAQDAVTSELQKRAAARAAWQSAARRSALDWLRHPVPAVTVNFVNEWLAVLHDALAALHPPIAVPGANAHNSNGAGVLALTNGAPDRAATAEPGENGSALAVRPRRRADPAALTEALDAIRELTSLHVTLPLLASTEILPTLKRLTTHPEPAIGSMARTALQNWVRVCGHQLHVLLDPHFVTDPRREAQATLKAAAERIGAVRRGREKPASSATPSLGSQLQPPAAAAVQELPSSNPGAAAAALGDPGAGPARSEVAGKSVPGPIALPSALALPTLSMPEGLPGGSAPQNILALLQEHAERLAGGGHSVQPITPGALLSHVLANNPAFTPPLSANDNERRRLEFGTPASLSFGALQALSQNLLSPGGSIGGAPGTSAAVVPDSAADAIAAEIAHQGLPMDVDPQASQALDGGPPAVPEKTTGARSSRGGSRLRMTTGGHAGADAPPDGGASVKVSGTARQRVAGPKDGAAASEGPKRRRRKRSSGAQLKELGLTSDNDSDDDEWGSSDDEDDDEGEADFEEDGVAGPMGMAVSFLARQKGRLAASKQRRVAHVCDQAVEGTLARLAAAGLDAAALPGVRSACEVMKAAAAKLNREAQPQANQKAKRDAEQALQHLADAVEALQ
ncbi:hypothetical protein WJX75_001156 [Coccomyxa subellipsoidea]|uniref:Large ribosomal subunit protein uL23c n=1 Tax=Coccomyxa subellipsoidea TaxID=248742 RepID=A0ABR2YT53_9CHLO